MTIAELRALVALCVVPGLGEHRATLLLRRFGSAQAVLKAGAAALDGRTRVALDSEHVQSRVAYAEEVCGALDVTVLSCLDSDYPVMPIEVPPPVLFLRGDITLLRRTMAAVVGTRTCSEYGADVARQIGTALGRARVPLVSGLARGIDGIAHDAALRAGGTTVAVLGCGIDICYPPEHGWLQERIAAQGLLVTQYAPGSPPLPDHFVRRNRLIAGLSRATVVVEGTHQSGALSTARRVVEQGSELLAVPGPIGRPASEGPLALLRDGALIYTDPLDLLVALGVDGEALAAGLGEGVRGESREARATAAPSVHAELWQVLAREAKPIDAIVAASGTPTQRVLAGLLELELTGHVEQLPGMRFRRSG